MCASTVQVAAPPGEVVSNTGKQNRKVLATPVMESFASITGVTTLLRQKHGNCPPLQYFYIRFPLPNGPSILSCLFLLWTVPMLVPQRWSDTGRSAIMNPNINFYGIVILLRKLRECGSFTEKELRKIAARIAADNGVEVMFFL